LAHLRRTAHAGLGDPDRICDGAGGEDPSPDGVEVGADALGIFEWSAPVGAGVDDRAAWAQANPALGHMITERALRHARHTDPEWVFRTEVLCQWSAGSLEGPFPPGAWEACLDVSSSIAAAGELVAGVDVSADRTWAHVAFAGYNAASELHVEVAASRAGVDWVVGWLVERCGRLPVREVVVQKLGAPASPLIEELEAAGVPVRAWGGADMTAGTGLFYDLVRTCRLRHLEQPVLDLAASTAATRPSGDAWLWNRRASPADIAPLVAATEAVWGLRNNAPTLKSAYEDGGLVIA
jgi:hypothetical protein